MPTRNQAHEQLIDDILLAHNEPGVRILWKHPTGRVQSMKGPWISYGLKGSSDIIGLCACGLFLGIEVKTGAASQSKGQKSFQAMVELHGGFYTVARDTEIEWPACACRG